MTKNRMVTLALVALTAFFASCNNSGTATTGSDSATHASDSSATTGTEDLRGIHQEESDYSAGGVDMKGLVVYSDSIKGKRPAVLVVHEWWGNNDYSKGRARQLAQLGYVAMAVDMYRGGQVAEDRHGAMT